LENKLKVCPFCGSQKLEILEWAFEGEAPTYQIECQGCGASGAVHTTQEEAIEDWNERYIGVNNELKLCPFCGKEVRMAYSMVKPYYNIVCDYCRISFRPFENLAKGQCIDWWNERA